MENENKTRTIVSVEDSSDGKYKVSVSQGTSVAEIAFAISVIIKVLDRDEAVSKENMLGLINKYLNDVQYQEVQS